MKAYSYDAKENKVYTLSKKEYTKRKNRRRMANASRAINRAQTKARA